MNRKIIHIDMDAFFASVEQRDNPELRGKPIAVGGSKDRGVVAAASYEARKFGVRSAMSSKLALQKCPELIFVKPNFENYKAVSLLVRTVFEEYTNLIEPLSLDEAYLDVTENKLGVLSATMIAEQIRKKIYDKVGLTASAGVSINKFLAKTASDVNKPDGIFVIPPKDVENFVKKLPIERFFGVGKVAETKLKEMNVYYGRDLLIYSREHLVYKFKKFGSYLYDVARGIDNRPVNAHRKRKSIGIERTFENDIESIDEVNNTFEKLYSLLMERLGKANKEGKTLVLKVKYYDFEQVTRSKTLEYDTFNDENIKKEALNMFNSLGKINKPIRLLGLSVTNFKELENRPSESQLTIDF